MRAVNLIPADARGAGSGAPGRSGGAVYVLLGGLAGLVLMAGLWASAHSGAASGRTELARLQQEAAAAQGRATALGEYRQATELRASRTATVTTLAKTRFDWAGLLTDLARTLPGDVHLTVLNGVVAGGPTVSLEGCAPSHARVAEVMTMLRSLPRVTGVSLASSTASQAGGQSSGGCGAAKRSAQFSLKLGYGSPAPAAGAPAPAAPGAPAPAGTATATTATPPPAAPGTATTAAGPATASAGATG
jgi:Tfp pilus assembly protein PilN